MYEEQISELKEELREYAELQKQRLKLRSVELLSAYLVQMVLLLFGTVLVMLVLLLASFALSNYLNAILLSDYMGYLIVAAFYALIFLLGYVFREPLFHASLRNKIIRKLVQLLNEEKS